MTLYALNLFDLADDDSYRLYSRRSVVAVGKHGGSVVALGWLEGAVEGDPAVEPRAVMVLVEWLAREAFDAFLGDPGHEDLHPLRDDGTSSYLWWTYYRLEDLRPLFAAGRRAKEPEPQVAGAGRHRITWPVPWETETGDREQAQNTRRPEGRELRKQRRSLRKPPGRAPRTVG